MGNFKFTKNCPLCGSKELIIHSELSYLSIAHIDCDSFTLIEKRWLVNQPTFSSRWKRGVVAAACYVSGQFGIRSAIPTFQAKTLS